MSESDPQLRPARPALRVTWMEQVKSGSRGAATAGRQKGRGRKVYQNLNIHQEYSGRLFLSRRTPQVTDGHFLKTQSLSNPLPELN